MSTAMAYHPAPAAMSRLRRALARWGRVASAHRGLIAVLGAALVLRLVLLASTGETPLQIADEQHYAELAASLAEGRGLAWRSGDLTSIRPPLYPLFVAGTWRLTRTGDLRAARAAQMALGLALIAAVYALGLRMFDRRAGLVAAAVVAGYPSLLFAGILLTTEVLFSLLVVLVTLQYAAFLHRPGPVRALLIGATVGLAALTRSVLWPLPIALLPLVFLGLPGARSRRGALALCVLAGYAAVVGPWAARNTLLQRTPTVVDTMGGLNLRMGNYEHTPEDRMWDGVSVAGDRHWAHALRQAHPDSGRWTEGQKDKWALRAALDYMAAHPGTTLRRALLKLADLWGLERELVAGLQQRLYQPPAWFAAAAAAGTLLAYPAVLLLAVVGLAAAIPSDVRAHALVATLLIFVSAMHAAAFGHSRYHLPLIPILAAYAAAACSAAPWRRLAAEPRRAVGAGLAAASLVAIWAREILSRDADRIRLFIEALG